jgi:purine nucleoside phosphorylase
MSTVWETIALCHSGARVAGLSLISNAGAGMSDEKLDHFVILDTCRAAAAKIVRGLFAAMEKELKL